MGCMYCSGVFSSPEKDFLRGCVFRHVQWMALSRPHIHLLGTFEPNCLAYLRSTADRVKAEL
jgi:hypothetical protein